MVPFIAQGHMNQLLHLSRLISAYNIPIHFITTTTHGRQAKLRLHGWDLVSKATIKFHEIKTPHYISCPPDPNAVIKFPAHLQPSFDATLLLREPIANLIQNLSRNAKRLVVIYDFMMTYVVQDVAILSNAEAYVFRPLSVFYMFWSSWDKLGKPFDIEPEIQRHQPSLQETTTPEFKELLKIQGIHQNFHSGVILDTSRVIEGIQRHQPSLQETTTPEFKELLKIQGIHQNFHSGVILDTSRVIEGIYVDLFTRKEIIGNFKSWAIGPFNPLEVANSNTRHECLEWLDKQEPSSVIYVSFGTITTLSKDEIYQLAVGLEDSEQNFLWVLRDADRGDTFGEQVQRPDLDLELPKGYEERVKGKGMIVRNWAPQMEILGHPSTGGFISHCGWNSSLESLAAGVPMITWPMHSDQPGNAVLITKVLKAGLVMKKWEDRNEIVSSKSVEKVVRRLMKSQEGEEIRKRAKEMREAIKRSVAEGGEMRLELDSFIAQIIK